MHFVERFFHMIKLYLIKLNCIKYEGENNNDYL